MIYTADYLIEKRKEKWDNLKDIEYDKKLRLSIANEIINNKNLLDEIKKYPEKLIELVFVVVDKNQNTIPFFLNEVQKDFIKKLNKAKEDYKKGKITDISMLILKGRQQGFTTLITGYQFACSILNKNFQGMTLADKNDNSESIFQNKAKFIYNQLPPTLKPTEKFNNKRQFMFEKINSSWSVGVATKNVGRSKTINFFHGSECAFWEDGIASIQAGLGEAFTKDCIKIYESTANGYNDYQKMWDSNVHINCFYEWWNTYEYRLKISSKKIKDEFISNIDKKDDWIFQRLKWLKDIKKLDIEQLYWYYKKYEKYLDKDLIKQEYPCSPEEAFLLSGKTAFDVEKIIERIQYLKSNKKDKALKIGYFTYDYDGKKITNIKWVNDKNGYIKIFKLPNTPKITKYCLSGDTAGEGSDYFTGYVIDAKSGEQVASLRHKFDSDLYTKQMYCLGMYYKYALIGIESNFDSYPIMELQRLGYLNMYVREKVDEYTGRTEKKFGFRTTSITRPIIINRLIQIIREEIYLINDIDILEELMTIIKNEKGRIEAPEGGHDDQMMGLAIGYQIREQVIFNDEVIEGFSDNKFNDRQIELNNDYGEEITII